MAYRGFLQLGQTEIANSRRTVQYMKNGVRNVTAEVVTDDSWPGTARFLGREDDYVLPELDDDCPWFDPRESASAEFAGVWPMNVEGLETTPLEREIVEGAVSGGAPGVERTPPRVIQVEAVLAARTPAGLRYGLQWLEAALRADRGEASGRPRRLVFLDSAPAYDPLMSDEELLRLANPESRLIVDVVQTGELTVEEYFGVWGYEDRQATSARVSFELTAGVPWIWRNPTNLVGGIMLAGGVEQSLRFENVGEGGALERCDDGDNELLRDPETAPFVEVPRAVTPAAAVGMQPLQSRRSTWRLNAGRLPLWSDTVPSVSVNTGAKAERYIRVQWVRGVVETQDDVLCNAIGEAMVQYLPPRATLTLDALTGDARVITSEGQDLDATPVTTGRFGGPWRAPVLNGTETYTLVVDSLVDVAEDVSVSVDAYVRQG